MQAKISGADAQLMAEKMTEVAALAPCYPGAAIVFNGDARQVLYTSD